jgi:hypothetical protein
MSYESACERERDKAQQAANKPRPIENKSPGEKGKSGGIGKTGKSGKANRNCGIGESGNDGKKGGK